MEFDFQWLLIGLPVAFALGWLASRFDLRQWRRSDRDSPKAYFKGLNLLLNEQQDKAIDAFIEAVQNDPDTTELHFALGNLFRRRGEFERAVRVHQHLLQRGDLNSSERERAQHALAQDYMKAGLFDRAEEAFRALEGTPFHTEARLARLGLYERSRDWPAAAEVAALLEQSGTGSFAQRIAHYHCELALAADDRGDTAAADQALQRARQIAPQAARPLILLAQRHLKAGRAQEALATWAELRERQPESFALVAGDYAACALALNQADLARSTLGALVKQRPGIDLLRALALLNGQSAGASDGVRDWLRQQPTLSAALEVLDADNDKLQGPELKAVREAVARAARPLQRYRCAACGFEAQRYFWQCPGCLNWDSYPPVRVEEA
ncbi:putative N-acetylglucosaminyl transferase [Burkholderiales bacterium JOSHI_001]|nr:putative N-acetylglucosaminyl transferase [Burkholderiales bacterium JOSHI_001]